MFALGLSFRRQPRAPIVPIARAILAPPRTRNFCAPVCAGLAHQYAQALRTSMRRPCAPVRAGLAHQCAQIPHACAGTIGGMGACQGQGARGLGKSGPIFTLRDQGGGQTDLENVFYGNISFYLAAARAQKPGQAVPFLVFLRSIWHAKTVR